MSSLRYHFFTFTPSSIALLVCGALSTACAFVAPRVERIDRGERWEGRYIPAAAYAWHARGAYLEQRGDFGAAALAYQEALSLDPESGATWARLGAVLCEQAAKTDVPEGAEGTASETARLADESFENSQATGRDQTELLVARGNCAIRRGQGGAALQDGFAAVRLSPRSLRASFLVIDALEMTGDHPSALRWLDALAARYPHLRIVHERREAMARQAGDERRLEAALHALRPDELASANAPLAIGGVWDAVDDALRRSDLPQARQLAIEVGLGPAAIALRAIALGRASLGLEQAELVLGADPHDPNALIAALVASDLTRNDEAFRKHLTAADAGNDDTTLAAPASLSPLAVLLFAEMLKRRAGPAAAQAWLASSGGLTSEDPLAATVRERLSL